MLRRTRTSGEGWVNEVRDRAREIAPALGLEAQAEELSAMIGTVRATLSAPAAIARAGGAPYDTDRVARFEKPP